MPPFRVVEGNLRHAMRFFACPGDPAAVTEAPGLILIRSPVDYPVFNAALLSSPVSEAAPDLESRLRAARDHYKGLRLRWSCWVCEDLLEGLVRRRAPDIFLRQGLREIAVHSGMGAEQLRPPRRRMPEMEFRRVHDLATRREFGEIAAVAFDLPLAIARRIYDAEPAWEGDFVAWVGYQDGAPIATAATVVAADAIGVYSVATLPEHRRRGVGEAIMRYAVDQAKRTSGLERTILQSTEAGYSLYREMGYQKVTSFTVYVSG